MSLLVSNRSIEMDLLKFAQCGAWKKIKRNGYFRNRKQKHLIPLLNKHADTKIRRKSPETSSCDEHNYARSSIIILDNTPSTVQGINIDGQNIESGSHCEISINTPTLGACEEVAMESTDNVIENVDDDVAIGNLNEEEEPAAIENSMADQPIFEERDGENIDPDGYIKDVLFANQIVNNSFRERLSQWAIHHQITRSAVNSLLILLRDEDPDNNGDLPMDGRTLIGTPRITNIVVHDNANQYWHYGLKRGISDIFSRRQAVADDNYSLNVNIDGLPLFRSSTLSFWPILVQLHELRDCTDPIIIGIHSGKSE